MASRRKEHQEDAKYRVLQIISNNAQITSREIAQKVGISNGSAYYLLISLIDKRLIKLENFRKSEQKTKYSYILTPKGIREKSFITGKVLVRKQQEYELLKKEITELKRNFS
ncbi:MarR family EPS-associated transcriptional regulator [Amylibacter sp.]|nr:MarR family EPS-associated transcriptional regulator [Amylibacter sp.]MDB2537304.1 MarR family EPS-associated transcriptional regulator [Amylibacter sp.]MDC1041471.1 MarR family EPS-associated transcriptional regulator [Amylibacter sp.]